MKQGIIEKAGGWTAYNTAFQRERRKRAKAEGRCCMCCKRKPLPARNYCRKCITIRNAAVARYHARKGNQE